MAEWLLRGTVNTFFRGSIPLNALNFYSEHVEIGKQSPLKKEWK
jgi:hypothetical protein